MESNPNESSQIVLGSKLGKARVSSEITLARSARQLGVTAKTISNFESGRAAPSLPQLELLAALYKTPIESLLTDEDSLELQPGIESEKIASFIDLRNQIIAATLKQSRSQQELTLKHLAEVSGISTNRLRKFESGSLPIPSPVLQTLCDNLGMKMETLLSPLTPITQTEMNEAVNDSALTSLPDELVEFAADPKNLPYLALAQRLSQIDSEKLRSIAVNLLEITA